MIASATQAGRADAGARRRYGVGSDGERYSIRDSRWWSEYNIAYSEIERGDWELWFANARDLPVRDLAEAS